MSNLTITVDPNVLKQARLRALEQGTSVNALLREFLEDYTGVHRQRDDAVRDLLAISEQSRSRRGGRSWTRDELHERSV